MDSNHITENIRILGDFLGIRDIDLLTRQELKEKYHFDKADVMVLFGGSILCGGDILADAMKQDIAKCYVIVGGAGHTTETLRQRMHAAYPQIVTQDRSEAEIFDAYLKWRHGIQADYLECRSTNCGNNITGLLELLKEQGISFRSIILCQDAAMQRRMAAGLRKYVPEQTVIINYAVYRAVVEERAGEPVFSGNIWGMWDMERYITLLMGEIPRLFDDENGYGPNGKNYIAHEEIPDRVRAAFEELKKNYGALIRKPDPLYASGQNG